MELKILCGFADVNIDNVRVVHNKMKRISMIQFKEEQLWQFI